MDISILLALQNMRESIGGTLNTFFSFITTVSVDYWVIIPALIFYWAIDKKKGQMLLFSAGLGRLFTAVMKSIFCIYRPWVRDSRIQPLQEVMSGATGYSFPSGHSSSASSLYAALAVIYRKYKGIISFCMIMIFLTMFSRLYVGVHTPQDVLAGAALGFAAAIAGVKIVEWVEKDPGRDRVILAVTIALTAVVLAFISFKKYPTDYVNGELLVDPKKMTVDGFKDPGTCFGMILGWFLERRFINFSTEGTKYCRFTRCAVGALAYIFTLTAVVNPLGKSIGIGIVHFALQALLPMCFMTVYPIIFTKIEKKHSEQNVL